MVPTSDFQILTSQCGKPQILYEARIYRQDTVKKKIKNPTASKSLRWKWCSGQNKCPAIISTDEKITEIVAIKSNHLDPCQPKSDKALQYRKIAHQVKRKAVDDLTDASEVLVNLSLIHI